MDQCNLRKYKITLQRGLVYFIKFIRYDWKFVASFCELKDEINNKKYRTWLCEMWGFF